MSFYYLALAGFQALWCDSPNLHLLIIKLSAAAASSRPSYRINLQVPGNNSQAEMVRVPFIVFFFYFYEWEQSVLSAFGKKKGEHVILK